MRQHFQDELTTLRQNLLDIAQLVEDSITNALISFQEKKTDLANQVIEEDNKINDEEVRFEEECLKILALYQPVAIDLRVIVAYLKINNDLEKVGDLSANIAAKAHFLSRNDLKNSIDIDFNLMGNRTKKLFKDSLDCLVHLNTDIARKVIASDDEIDDMKRSYSRTITEAMKKSPDDIEILLRYLSVVRALERIADMAVNLAEDVIYVVEGDIIRHLDADNI